MIMLLVGAIIVFLFSIFALIFSLTRISGYNREDFPNRGRYFSGLILWIAAAVVSIFMSFPGYPEWFVPEVYPLLTGLLAALFLVGFFLVVTTVISFPSHFSHLRRDVTSRSDRIALLENIRQIAAQPYPMTEIFTLSLREIGNFMGLKEGAIFLINPSRRELYLAAQIGLSRDELARLEHFPLGQDMISKAAQEQTPLVSGDIGAADHATRKLIASPDTAQRSAAAIPLSSHDRPIGCMLVFSTTLYRFEKQDRMLLSAASEAIAAVVEYNRIHRESQKLEKLYREKSSALTNLYQAVGTLKTEKDLNELLLTLADHASREHDVYRIRFVEAVNGLLEEHASYAAVDDLAPDSESYKAALMQAARKKKMLILNQEATTGDGTKVIRRSTLAVPLFPDGERNALLLIEAAGNALRLSEATLAEFEAYAALAASVMSKAELDQNVAVGKSSLGCFLDILRTVETDAAALTEKFLNAVSGILPESALAVLARKTETGSFVAVPSGINIADTDEYGEFMPGEGPIGQCAATGRVMETTGREQIRKAWEETVDPANADFLGRLFGEMERPDFAVCIPIQVLDEIRAVLTIFDRGYALRLPQSGTALRLACQLLAVKLTIAELSEKSSTYEIGEPDVQLAQFLNHLNNDLATVIGRAELIQKGEEVPGPVRYTVDEIAKAAESAASRIKKIQQDKNPPVSTSGDEMGLADRLQNILRRHRVTGNLFMFAGDHAVMLETSLDKDGETTSVHFALEEILDGLLGTFAALVEEGEAIRLQTDIRENSFYLTLIRQQPMAPRTYAPENHDFGAPDVMPESLLTKELGDRLAEAGGEVSFDRFGRQPTYVSIRVPLAGQPKAEDGEGEDTGGTSGLRILAIDDQQMILDLLASICQSLGIELTAVVDPNEGIARFSRNSHDIVMTDLAMGSMSGWDVARRIKEQSPDTPVILMTGWGIQFSEEEKSRGGVDFTLIKPFKIENLTDVIARARARRISS